MNKIIKDILNRNITTEEKEKLLDELSEDINIAYKLLEGEFTYCENCNDYYLTESFLTRTEVKEEKICVYVDPINSSGDEYKDGYVEIVSKICPKGHIHVISRKEREV